MRGNASGWLCTLLCAAGICSNGSPAAAQNLRTEKHALRVVTIAEGLEHPWALAFLPDGRMLVSERPGRLRIVDRAGRLSPPLAGLPKPYARDGAGFLDIALDPDFRRNRLVYLAYAEGNDNWAGLALGRGVLERDRVRNFRVIFRQRTKARATGSFGARIVFAPDGHLFLTVGDLLEKHRAQDFSAQRGHVIRIARDGAVPRSNPLLRSPEYWPETWSVGHRNPQGAALHPVTRELWLVDHGEQGGDEVNVVEAGKNYGWPVISYSREYRTGAKLGFGTHMDGLEQPIHHWTPAIAPSGMAFYTGGRFTQWRGNLLIGALAGRALIRLELDGRRIVREERLLRELGERIRDVRQGPDEFVYLLTDSPRGRILRLEAVPE